MHVSNVHCTCEKNCIYIYSKLGLERGVGISQVGKQAWGSGVNPYLHVLIVLARGRRTFLRKPSARKYFCFLFTKETDICLNSIVSSFANQV